jgi:hypothetical protein
MEKKFIVLLFLLSSFFLFSCNNDFNNHQDLEPTQNSKMGFSIKLPSRTSRSINYYTQNDASFYLVKINKESDVIEEKKGNPGDTLIFTVNFEGEYEILVESYNESEKLISFGKESKSIKFEDGIITIDVSLIPYIKSKTVDFSFSIQTLKTTGVEYFNESDLSYYQIRLYENDEELHSSILNADNFSYTFEEDKNIKLVVDAYDNNANIIASGTLEENITLKNQKVLYNLDLIPCIKSIDLGINIDWGNPNEYYANYKVEHYQQNSLDDEYSLVHSEYYIGVIGEYTKGIAKEYRGFNSKPIDQKLITSDGNTVIKIYYDRKTIILSFYITENSDIPYLIKTGKYGCLLDDVEAPELDGYVFKKWSLSNIEYYPAENTSVYAEWSLAEVTSVSLPSEISVNRNGVISITPYVLPRTAQPTFYWSTSDSTIATIHSAGDGTSGNVTGIAAGTTIITVVTDNGISASTIVTVNYTADPVSISIPESYTVKRGQQWDIPITLEPSDAQSLYSISSEDSSIVIVNTTGGNSGVRVRGASEGTTLVTVFTNNGLSAVCEITVEDSPYPNSIEIPKTHSMISGATWDVPITILPINCFNSYYTVSTSDSNIFTVNTTGGNSGVRVKAYTPGTATLTIGTENDIYAICVITVE